MYIYIYLYICIYIRVCLPANGELKPRTSIVIEYCQCNTNVCSLQSIQSVRYTFIIFYHISLLLAMIFDTSFFFFFFFMERSGIIVLIAFNQIIFYEQVERITGRTNILIIRNQIESWTTPAYFTDFLERAWVLCKIL